MKRQRGVTGLEAIALLAALMGGIAAIGGKAANLYESACVNGGGEWTDLPAYCSKAPWELRRR